jgi:hypothetical protein
MTTRHLGGISVEVCDEHGVWVEGRSQQILCRLRGGVRRLGRLTAGTLCVLQILGISVSVLAAIWDIESITWTGPIFSMVGVLVALDSRVSRSASHVLFGLSTAAVSVFCLFWIVSLSWSPRDAAVPVSSALICYELLIMPVGCLALYRTLRPLEPHGATDSRPWQFSIGGLLLATAVLAVALSAGRLVYDYGQGVRVAVAAALLVLSIVGIGIALAKGLTPSAETTDPRRHQLTLTLPESTGDVAR